MLANLRNIFSPAAIVQTLAALKPLETTYMDLFFKQRPTHPLPMIGLAELHEVLRTVPVVRRDGTAISLGGREFEAQFFAPLPIKVQVNVSASELNDLRAFLGQPQSVEAWRTRKIEQMRTTIRNTTEAMCVGVLNQGKVSWPVRLEGGSTETYEIDYGPVQTYTPDAPLDADTPLGAIYNLLLDMSRLIQEAGMGGKVEFLAGRDVATVLLNIVSASITTTATHPYHLELGSGKISVGAFVIHFMQERYPSPVDGAWLPKLDPKTLMAVAVDQPGTIYYCALDSISAGNAALPLHIVPTARDDDTGITLMAHTKPLPVRPSKAVCKAVVVA